MSFPDGGDRLASEFVRLCEFESPSRREQEVGRYVRDELDGLGLGVEEDASPAETGSQIGNLLVRIAGPPGAPVILFCAHLDTVPLAAAVEVEERNGFFVNRNEAILGADNKAAVVVLLELARRLVRDPPPIGVELLFTTCEELALLGAKAFDIASLSARFGFVFDHASPIGELILAAPSYYRLQARLHGRAAHAGVRPEDGHNAIAAAAAGIASLRLGRIDAETTANVGTIGGGSAPNVVAEHCVVELEARSLDHERAGALVSEMVDSFTAAATDAECDLEVVAEELFRAYSLPRSCEPVRIAAAALESCGIEPVYVSTGGGSDANVFNLAGLPTVNLANGTERNHQPDERVSRDALERMLEVAVALVRTAGIECRPAWPGADGNDTR
ncbi:MAG: M20/M25/M40 family metallo-hydrolase [Thermoleophilaceae bacterium]|nr:M20/M25/M40 family metallo-hydrolase [Thermoleophilaceae bacterium]